MGTFLWSVRLLRKVINYLSKIEGISRTARGSRMKNPVMHDLL